MEVIANGQQIPFTLDDEKHFLDVLQTLLGLTNQANKLVLECKLNGEVVSLLDRSGFADIPVSQVEKIELVVANKDERIKESLAEINNALTAFIESFGEVSNLLIAGQKQSALKKFAATLEQWRKVVNFLRVIEASCSLDFKTLAVDGKTVEETNSELYGVLAEVKTAIENEDVVAIGDLVEYELKDKLEEQKKVCLVIEKQVTLQTQQKAKQTAEQCN